MQIEDLSQQAQMAAAEKFKAPEQPVVEGGPPTAEVRPLHESDEDEVRVHARHHHIMSSLPTAVACVS